MFNDRTSTLSLLQTRRSGRPRDMVAPGPSRDELARILAIAARTPDHGKLAPWRFIHVPQDRREAFAELLHRAYRVDNPQPTRLEVEAVDRFARQAPELVIVLFSPVIPSKIPVWEQELSCGAACMNLLTATHALGYTGGWITGWAAYSQMVLRALGAAEAERVAGFIFLGTPGAAQEERPRPELRAVVREWSPAG